MAHYQPMYAEYHSHNNNSNNNNAVHAAHPPPQLQHANGHGHAHGQAHAHAQPPPQSMELQPGHAGAAADQQIQHPYPTPVPNARQRLIELLRKHGLPIHKFINQEMEVSIDDLTNLNQKNFGEFCTFFKLNILEKIRFERLVNELSGGEDLKKKNIDTYNQSKAIACSPNESLMVQQLDDEYGKIEHIAHLIELMLSRINENSDHCHQRLNHIFSMQKDAILNALQLKQQSLHQQINEFKEKQKTFLQSQFKHIDEYQADVAQTRSALSGVLETQPYGEDRESVISQITQSLFSSSGDYARYQSPSELGDHLDEIAKEIKIEHQPNTVTKCIERMVAVHDGVDDQINSKMNEIHKIFKQQQQNSQQIMPVPLQRVTRGGSLDHHEASLPPQQQQQQQQQQPSINRGAFASQSMFVLHDDFKFNGLQNSVSQPQQQQHHALLGNRSASFSAAAFVHKLPQQPQVHQQQLHHPHVQQQQHHQHVHQSQLQQQQIQQQQQQPRQLYNHAMFEHDQAPKRGSYGSYAHLNNNQNIDMNQPIRIRNRPHSFAYGSNSGDKAVSVPMFHFTPNGNIPPVPDVPLSSLPMSPLVISSQYSYPPQPMMSSVDEELQLAANLKSPPFSPPAERQQQLQQQQQIQQQQQMMMNENALPRFSPPGQYGLSAPDFGFRNNHPLLSNMNGNANGNHVNGNQMPVQFNGYNNGNSNELFNQRSNSQSQSTSYSVSHSQSPMQQQPNRVDGPRVDGARVNRQYQNEGHNHSYKQNNHNHNRALSAALVHPPRNDELHVTPMGGITVPPASGPSETSVVSSPPSKHQSHNNHVTRRSSFPPVLSQSESNHEADAELQAFLQETLDADAKENDGESEPSIEAMFEPLKPTEDDQSVTMQSTPIPHPNMFGGAAAMMMMKQQQQIAIHELKKEEGDVALVHAKPPSHINSHLDRNITLAANCDVAQHRKISANSQQSRSSALSRSRIQSFQSASSQEMGASRWAIFGVGENEHYEFGVVHNHNLSVFTAMDWRVDDALAAALNVISAADETSAEDEKSESVAVTAHDAAAHRLRTHVYAECLQSIRSGPEWHMYLFASGALYIAGSNASNCFSVGPQTHGNIERLTRHPFFDSHDIPITYLSSGCSGQHSFVIDEHDHIYAMGECSHFQLALDEDETATARHSLRPIKLSFFEKFQTKITRIGCGKRFTIFVSAMGSAYACGTNIFGALGWGDEITCLKQPKSIDGLKKVQSLDVECGENHVCILDASGKVYTFGINNQGQLGRNTKNNLDYPGLVQVSAKKFSMAQSQTKIVRIASGANHIAVVSETGKCYVWGANDRGQIGDGTQAVQYKPKQLLKGESIKDVQCGENHTIFITKERKVYVCGCNEYGQCQKQVGNKKSGKAKLRNFVLTPRLLTFENNPDIDQQVKKVFAGCRSTFVAVDTAMEILRVSV